MNLSKVPKRGRIIDSSFFITDQFTFVYQVRLRRNGKREKLTYNTLQDVILNAIHLDATSSITYIIRSTNEILFSLTANSFRNIIIESLEGKVYDQVEIAYLNLLYHNLKAKSIVDKGRMRHIDYYLNKLIHSENKHTREFHLALEKLRTICYVKVRSTSLIVIRAVILNYYDEHNPDAFWITIPKATQINHERFCELLNVELGSKVGLTVKIFNEEERLPKTNFKRLMLVITDAIRFLIKDLK